MHAVDECVFEGERERAQLTLGRSPSYDKDGSRFATKGRDVITCMAIGNDAGLACTILEWAYFRVPTYFGCSPSSMASNLLGVAPYDAEDQLELSLRQSFQLVENIVVAACRGVDVTPKKLACKYVEVYMALDIVLHGVSFIRLFDMLSSMHEEGITKMVHSTLDTEVEIYGVDSWPALEPHSLDHIIGIEAFSTNRFEMSPDTITASD
ncbi:hypothetical protein SAY87_032257 [Trapa incisa]|uniref:Uncharacterized protein n=1 Tax=Trapa incisa TaxID=236973 RepID=A0AAN7GC30_9MYRT|nr:hypothetical protein SAY87_032257 [Trapa incisa]